MRMSPAGFVFLQAQEGFREQAYPDVATGGKPYTIGYGSTRWHGVAVLPGWVMTEAEARMQLSADLIPLETLLSHVVTAPLTQGQTDALLSFLYNIGARAFLESQVLVALNRGAYVAAADHLLEWNQAGGRTLPGLRRRRERERALFLGETA